MRRQAHSVADVLDAEEGEMTDLLLPGGLTLAWQGVPGQGLVETSLARMTLLPRAHISVCRQ